ncbi:DUF6286 domain-containing protein [Nocardia jejuensis]|uniref:DUF6286 domain-containing protein n=1 Tax=Nocardia jejuensis TaxID=328049 RepID=UPI0008337F13|nr:DUF6286 domain-containing protein [Nocardia jejuensis]
MIRKPRRVVPAVLVALAFLALCLIATVSLIQKLTGDKELVSYDSLADRLQHTQWGNTGVLAVGVLTAAAGVALLVVALVPGRPVVLPLEDIDGNPAGITRRSLCSEVRGDTESVRGIDSARVRLGGRKIRVSAAVSPGPLAPVPPIPSASGATGSVQPDTTGTALSDAAGPTVPDPAPSTVPGAAGPESVSVPGVPITADAVAGVGSAAESGTPSSPADAVQQAVSATLDRIRPARMEVRTRLRAARRGGTTR